MKKIYDFAKQKALITLAVLICCFAFTFRISAQSQEWSKIIEVRATPTVTMPGEVCQGEGVQIVFTGQAPFVVTYTVNGEDPDSVGLPASPMVVNSNEIIIIAGSAGTFLFEGAFVDDNGCNSGNLQHEIIVKPRPEVSISTKDVCVNDSIKLNFLGTPPFVLNYEVSINGGQYVNPTLIGLPNPITVNDYYYDIIAGQEGNFTFNLVRLIDATGCEAIKPLQHIIDVHPLPTLSFASSGNSFCEGQTITAMFTGKAPFVIEYTVNGDDPTLEGFPASPINVNSNEYKFIANTVGAFVFEGTIADANGCENAFVDEISVKKVPDVIAENFIYCDGDEVEKYMFTSLTPTTGDKVIFTWKRIIGYDLGLPQISGTDTIPSFTAVNKGFYPIVAIYSVTPSNGTCVGETQYFMITVNPTPVTSVVQDMVYCNGTTAYPYTFSSDIPDVHIEWEYVSGTQIAGIPTSGLSSIPSFVAYNTTNAIITGKYRVRSSFTYANHTCYGEWEEFNIVILPTPTVVVNPEDQIICSGATTTAIAFSGSVSDNVTYKWHRIAGEIAGIASIGEGNVPALTLTNTTMEPIVLIYEVIPVYNNPSFPAYKCEGEPAQFTIIINPSAIVDAVSNLIYCNGEIAPRYDFTGNNPNASYTWTFVSGNQITGLPANGTDYLPSFAAQNTGTTTLIGTYRVTPFVGNCTGTPVDFTISVLPTPSVTATPNYQSICSGENIQTISFTSGVSGVSFEWNRISGVIPGLPINGTSTSFTYGSALVNNTLEPFTATYEVVAVVNLNGHICKSTTGAQFTIVVNPVPQMATVENMVYCSGEIAPKYNFSSNNINASYVWNFVSGDAIPGLPTSGNNYIPSFAAQNTGSTILTGVYNVYPVMGDCEGEQMEFTITVMPNPQVTVLPSYQEVCSGSTMLPVVLSSATPSVTFEWHRISGQIPQIPASGTGNTITASGALVNNGFLPLEAVYEVVAVITVNGHTCKTAIPAQFTVVVNPSAQLMGVQDFVYCNGTVAPAYQFTGTNPLALYEYSFTSGTPIQGVPSYGFNAIPSFVAQNNSSELIIGTYTVIPFYSGCEGEAAEFTITILPTPDVTITPEMQVVCSGETTQPITFTSSTEGDIIYRWTRISGNIAEIPAVGEGNLPVYTLTNNGTEIIQAVYQVVAIYNYTEFGLQCSSTVNARQFSISVLPEARINEIPEMTYCAGEVVPSYSFGNMSNVTYKWALTNGVNIGLPASGEGNLPSFVAFNGSNTETVEAIYEVTLLVGGYNYECSTAVQFSIFVKPAPSVALEIGPYNFCNGEITPELDFAVEFASLGNPETTQYEWEYVSGSNVGLFALSGINVMPSFIAVNASNTNTFAVYRVRAINNGCVSTEWRTFKVVVRPNAPVFTAPDSKIYGCVNEEFTIAIGVEPPTSDLVYIWYYNGVEIPGVVGSTYTAIFDVKTAGTYTIEIRNVCGESIMFTCEVLLNPIIIEQKFDDVLYIDNTGDIFVAYKWYKNGELVAEWGTSQYYTEPGGFTYMAEYNLRAYKADGTYVEACPIIPNTTGKVKTYGIDIYPNPVYTGNNATLALVLPEDEKPAGKAYIYDMTGRKMNEYILTSHLTQVTMNLPTGTYLVRVLTSSGRELSNKIIVR